MQDYVRAHALAGLIVHYGLSAIVGQCVLHIVVQSAHEALGVEQLAEHQLAPIADLLVIAAEGVRQVRGCAIHALRLGDHLAELFGQRGRVARCGIVRLLNGCAQLRQVLTQGQGEALHVLRILALESLRGMVEHLSRDALELLLECGHLFVEALLMVCSVGFRLLSESVHRRHEGGTFGLQSRMLTRQPIALLLQLGSVRLGALPEQGLTRCRLFGQ